MRLLLFTALACLIYSSSMYSQSEVPHMAQANDVYMLQLNQGTEIDVTKFENFSKYGGNPLLEIEVLLDNCLADGEKCDGYGSGCEKCAFCTPKKHLVGPEKDNCKQCWLGAACWQYAAACCSGKHMGCAAGQTPKCAPACIAEGDKCVGPGMGCDKCDESDYTPGCCDGLHHTGCGWGQTPRCVSAD